MGRYRFWVHDKDKKGQPLDEKILNRTLSLVLKALAPSETNARQ